jgi:hypothetical protein
MVARSGKTEEQKKGGVSFVMDAKEAYNTHQLAQLQVRHFHDEVGAEGSLGRYNRQAESPAVTVTEGGRQCW